jgi:hypothetical protein
MDKYQTVTNASIDRLAQEFVFSFSNRILIGRNVVFKPASSAALRRPLVHKWGQALAAG